MSMPTHPRQAECPFRLLEWTSNDSVGHRLIDDQHKGLYQLYNRLVINVYCQCPDLNIIAIDSAEFYRILAAHCDQEEDIMRALKYSSISKHVEHHRFYIKSLRDLLTDNPNPAALRISTTYLRSIITDHVDRDDRDFGTFLSSHGIWGLV